MFNSENVFCSVGWADFVLLRDSLNSTALDYKRSKQIISKIFMIWPKNAVYSFNFQKSQRAYNLKKKF